MMRSLFSGVAGLKSHQTRMDVIGNNIANVNTTGFKASRVTFQDTLSQTLVGTSSATASRGGTNAQQIGLGVGVGSIDTIMTNGSTETTNKNTDLAISGAGFFVVNDGKNTYYTSNGNFSFDANGTYGMPGSGLKVQGWVADANGTIDTTGATTDIVVSADSSMAAKATTSAKYGKNLSADALSISSIAETMGDGSVGPTLTSTANLGTSVTLSTGTTNATVKSVTLTMSDGSTKTVSSNGTFTAGYSLPVATTITVYDSLGTAYSVPVTLTKKDNGTHPNEWVAHLASTSINKGAATASMTDVDIKFNSKGAYVSGSGSLGMTFTDGAAASTIPLDFSGLTQYGGESTATCTESDGYAAGAFKSVSFDGKGVATTTYTNGQKRTAAQVAMALCNNPSGLEKAGTSLYSASNNSGKIQVSTVNGAGCSVTPSALEMSNVDLASEFSSMIVTQRGYQSNSKIITVSDEMLETLIGMKR
jgi:fagellar hook-basal body proteins